VDPNSLKGSNYDPSLASSYNTVYASGPVGLVSSADTLHGTAGYNATFSFPSSQTGAQFTIRAIVGGYYRDEGGATQVSTGMWDSVLQVSQPITTGFITGGGYLLNNYTPVSSGQITADANSKTNFGFNVK